MSGRRIVDYHVHSNLSFDGSSTMFEICEKAVKLNIKEIGFTDHMDFNPRDLGYGFFEYEKYSSEIERTRYIFGEKIIVRKGIEIDYQSRYEDDVRRWLGDKEFDYAIGSVHYINDENVRYLSRKRPVNEVLEDYVDEVLHSVKSGLFDVIGHFTADFIRHLASGIGVKSDLQESEETVFREIIANELYLEVNTKELRGAYRETLPSKRIIEEYVKYGGKLFSVGSDAHSAEDVGYGINHVMESLEKLCDYSLIFEK
jgi:histidinol-phosphatase (PHP family)